MYVHIIATNYCTMTWKHNHLCTIQLKKRERAEKKCHLWITFLIVCFDLISFVYVFWYVVCVCLFVFVLCTLYMLMACGVALIGVVHVWLCFGVYVQKMWLFIENWRQPHRGPFRSRNRFKRNEKYESDVSLSSFNYCRV